MLTSQPSHYCVSAQGEVSGPQIGKHRTIRLTLVRTYD